MQLHSELLNTLSPDSIIGQVEQEPTVIRNSKRAYGRPKGGRRDPLSPYPRCKCGTCPMCLDNAKWDRVFAKFAVADYGDVKGMFQSPLRDI